MVGAPSSGGQPRGQDWESVRLPSCLAADLHRSEGRPHPPGRGVAQVVLVPLLVRRLLGQPLLPRVPLGRRRHCHRRPLHWPGPCS